jgi:hypothetical protein
MTLTDRLRRKKEVTRLECGTDSHDLMDQKLVVGAVKRKGQDKRASEKLIFNEN